MEVFENDLMNRGFVKIEGPVKYSEADDDCVMYITRPWKAEGRLPLTVFVQGSAWTHPNPMFELPQLCGLTRERNIVCASVIHRNCKNGHPFPAFLEDVKCAVRFLRANAEAYGADPARVGIWGTSSGGNTALLVGVTGDDPAYKTQEYAEYSDSVKFVVDCFGPSDMLKMHEDNGGAENPLFKSLSGDRDPSEVAFEMSPALRVRKGAAYPPMLILGGDSDDIVPFAQSEQMYEALRDNGNEAYLVKVTGAEHEGSFWSRALLSRIFEFIGDRI